jgi:DNA-binding NtrC family response regulator
MANPILLLDDDPVLLEVMAQVIEVYCGRSSLQIKGLAELQQRVEEVKRCSLAFLDINLGPDQPSGTEAFLWLKKVNFTGKTYFFTGHARTHPLVVQALALGEADLLTKPVDVDRLVKIIGVSP